MAEAGLSLTAFALAIGRSPGNVSNILKQDPTSKTQFKPPLEEMPRWADALHLNEVDKQHLIEAAELAHAPFGLRERYLKLKAALNDQLRVEPRTEIRLKALDTAKYTEIIEELKQRQALIDKMLEARRREDEAIALLHELNAQRHDDEWEPDTTPQPDRRVAEAPDKAGTPHGPYSP